MKEIGEARGLFALVNTRPKSVGRIKVWKGKEMGEVRGLKFKN